MKKTLISILAALMVIVAVDAAFAEAVKEPAGVVPAASGQEEAYAQERASVIAAVQAAAPGAVVDYVVRERDDGRIEWDVFFKQNGVLGQAEVFEDGLEVRKVEMFNQSREDSLTASEAAAKLMAEKGEMKIVKFDLDWDDGRLAYDGEAEMNGRFYEFEMDVNGRMLEWERD